MKPLEVQFRKLLETYTKDDDQAFKYWEEIKEHYSTDKKHYHTLGHLDHLYGQLEGIKGKLKNENVVLFTLYYHDIIYNVLKKDNEEKSAEVAKERMTSLGVPSKDIDRCVAQIIATKTHHVSEDSDCNYFTDADLSILGADWEDYRLYTENVRKEYAIYPMPLYKRGRQKVLKHFLDMKRIYKTDYFYNLLEEQARKNLKQELDSL